MLRGIHDVRRRTLLAVGLAAAALLFATASALAGNGSTTSPTGPEVEQLGPKYLLGPRSTQTRLITAQTRGLLVEEFGPKYLLGLELKAAQK